MSLLTAPIAVVVGAFFFTVSFLSIRRIRHREPKPTTVTTAGHGGLAGNVRLARDPSLPGPGGAVPGVGLSMS
ncbi:hypothetical protein [Streptomyces sp. NBC_01506]|uniref:hypothetical protein n=1 Tax=Streptomyces sp. NBC_01506 TaxID=2903887 RepID=UPI0038672FC1